MLGWAMKREQASAQSPLLARMLLHPTAYHACTSGWSPIRNIWLQMGVGKTVQALALASCYQVWLVKWPGCCCSFILASLVPCAFP